MLKTNVLGICLTLFIAAFAGLALTLPSAISGSINRFYFPRTHLLDTLTSWLGIAFALASLLEGLGLISWRRFHLPTSSP